MMKTIILSLVVLFAPVFNNFVRPQEKEKFIEAIEDNSFLVEEAYNQEYRVVQHISNGILQLKPVKNFMYTFTQEWPVTGVKHQLSYTIPLLFNNQSPGKGLGDIMLNYRYQLFYENDWASVSPRFSLILPTGIKSKGLGNGVVGAQVAIPASKRLTDFWVVHYNLGMTILPEVTSMTVSGNSVKKNLISYYTGGSIIYLANKNINYFIEFMDNLNTSISPEGKMEQLNQFVLNPGFRTAINIKKLQIVPGISLPLTFSSIPVICEIFFYLSFEHPF